MAGLNEYRDQTSCAYIYSSKPTKDDEPIMELFGLTADEIRVAREDEDVLQFAMRGAIRNADFGGDYDIYLYRKRQAETLVAQLSASGVGQSVVLVPVPGVGIMDVDPDPLGTLRRAATKAKAVSRKERDKVRKKEAREAVAIAQGRVAGKTGRPTKLPNKP